MGTSIGKVIDYLVNASTNGYTGTNIYGAPLTVPPLTTINENVVISDGWAPAESDVYVVYGRSNLDDTTAGSGTASYQVLGRQRIEESYTISGFVFVSGQGPDMKPVRDAAIALYDGIVKLVWADPTCGGVLEQGRIGLVAGLSLEQPNPGIDAGSGAGLLAAIPFTVQVQNAYIP